MHRGGGDACKDRRLPLVPAGIALTVQHLIREDEAGERLLDEGVLVSHHHQHNSHCIPIARKAKSQRLINLRVDLLPGSHTVLGSEVDTGQGLLYGEFTIGYGLQQRSQRSLRVLTIAEILRSTTKTARKILRDRLSARLPGRRPPSVTPTNGGVPQPDMREAAFYRSPEN
jgi:hypothetical protein